MIHALGVLAVITACAAAQQTPQFEQHILPILEKNCFSCHGAPKPDARGRIKGPKGDLRLDGAQWILKGGDSGSAVTAGEPLDSPLYELIILDTDDPDIMPAKGDPLSKKEQDLLKAWIEAGADFGGWVGSGGPAGAATAAPARIPTRVQRWLDLGKSVQPVSPAILTKWQKRARVDAVTEGSPLLSVAFRGREKAVTDRTLAELKALSANITELDLTRTEISDRGMGSLSSMRRLTRLDLSHTDITGAGLRALRDCDEIRELNLFGTGVTQRDLAVLKLLPKLERLHLGGTKVAAAALRTLRKEYPKLTVLGNPILPKPAAPQPQGQGRRRR